MDDKKKNIDFWSGSNVDFDSKKALDALALKVTQSVKADPDFWQDAPRLTLALATKPRTAEGRPESSVFQSFKGIPVQDLKRAGVKLDVEKGSVTFTGFENGATGMCDLDRYLQEAGALRRTAAVRCKGWPYISDATLASTPKLSPTDRVGNIAGAKQISIALPPNIARALPTYANASAMVGFFVEAGSLGLTVEDLVTYLQAKRQANSDTNNANNADVLLDEADVILVNTCANNGDDNT